MNPIFITTSDQKRIAVYESNGRGKTILLVHGNSLGAELFSKQINSDLGKKHRLIAFDLIGHGKSDVASNPQQSYSLQGLIDTIITVVDQMQLSDFIIAGHSLGGHLILQAADRLQKAKGIVIFGTPPISLPPDVSKLYHPHPALGLAYKSDLTTEEIKQLADAFILPNTPSDKTIIQLIKQTDKNFRSAFAASAFGGALKDETVIASKIKIPLAIFHGEKDQLVNCDYIKSLTIPTLWKKEVQIIKNAGHCPQWENPIAFNELLEKFALSVS